MAYTRYNRAVYVALSFKDKLMVPVILSILVFLLLVLFQPFEYRSYTFIRIIGDSLLSAFLVLIATACTRIVIPYFIKNRFENNQSILICEIKNVFLDIILFLTISFLTNIFFANFNSSNYLNWLKLSIRYVLIFEALFIPLSLFIKHYFLNNSISVVKENTVLSYKDKIKIPETLIFKLTSNLGLESIKISPYDLILVKSCDNYVEVFYKENNEVVSSLLRNTIYNISDMVSEYPFIIQCHRSYLINVNEVYKVAGNTRGYKLTINGVLDKVPVSRSKISLFKEAFKRIGK